MAYGKKSPVSVLKKFCKKEDCFENEDESYRVLMESLASTQISDAMYSTLGITGVLKGVKSVNNKKAFGKVVTARTNSNDWGTSLLAIDRASKGEILLIQVEDEDNAVWGELASTDAQKKGIVGTIVYGSSRDIDALLEMDFPVFSLSNKPNAGKPYANGELGIDLELDGLLVKNGDYAFADASGVVIIPQDKFDDVIYAAMEIKDNEEIIIEKLKKQTLSEILGIKKIN